MYFKSRVEAGQILATQIAKKYAGKPCAIVALSDGGVMVGTQIAMQLHAVLTMLLTAEINLPRENVAVGGISQEGAFSYNSDISTGELDDMVSEYRNFIEAEKLERLQQMHRQVGKGGLIRKDLLRHRNIILVTDGLQTGFSLDIAVEFLKPIETERIIVATPLASVPAVDHMHILADEIFCLNVLEDYISTDHYYDTPDVPDHETVVKTIEHIVAHWQ
ncbi:MAG TPA: phosphoribosyltransferase family protein [Candidatus Saccharimonadales bacterium]|jgi:predicted phosphoribosyltransferase|nr:phosphoribosyltransferase family protein [Candidatus Saccharimonadales bacterium]